MTIEGNKDEADKCIEIAQIAFSMGNIEKAEKFLLKAERLYPTARAKELLTRVRAAGATGSVPKRSPPSSPNSEEVRRRKPPTHQAPQREYTQEQVDAVRRIKTKCKDYYEILGKYYSHFLNYYSRSFLTSIHCLQTVTKIKIENVYCFVLCLINY